jgi:hypothetical protein
MKQQSEHKIIVRQENETTDRTQDHRKTGEWNNGQNTRCFILLSLGGLVFCPLFHSPVLRWSCVLTSVSFSCLTVVLCSVHCFILLSYAGLVFWLLFHSPVLLWSCVLTVVSFSYLEVVLCSVRCFILLSYGGLVFWLLFHSPVLRWSCVLSVVSFSCLTVVLCSVWCFILLSYVGFVFWQNTIPPQDRRMKQRTEHKTTVRQENETTDRTQHHRKTGEWNNGQNTRPP